MPQSEWAVCTTVNTREPGDTVLIVRSEDLRLLPIVEMLESEDAAAETVFAANC